MEAGNGPECHAGYRGGIHLQPRNSCLSCLYRQCSGWLPVHEVTCVESRLIQGVIFKNVPAGRGKKRRIYGGGWYLLLIIIPMTKSELMVSMTGFARVQAISGVSTLVWELRSVNGRGLDIKLRLPLGWEVLDLPLRESVVKQLRRGNVSGTLTLKRETASALQPDMEVLEKLKLLAIDLSDSIPGALPPRAELLLGLPGVIRMGVAPEETEVQRAVLAQAIQDSFLQAMADLAQSRQAEGQKLAVVIGQTLNEITKLREQALAEALRQPELHRARLTAQLAELLGSKTALSEERLAQEIAFLASKSDVREELDRLGAHIEAARNLLDEGVNIGRKLDFLMQEFNREANTLCSKSASTDLTTLGLALKLAIEQMREQVQNVE